MAHPLAHRLHQQAHRLARNGDMTLDAQDVLFAGKALNGGDKDFRISEFHQGGKTNTFKTRSQEMGYVEELRHFVDCVAGRAKPAVALGETFTTMAVIFAIERALASAQVVTVPAS